MQTINKHLSYFFHATRTSKKHAEKLVICMGHPIIPFQFPGTTPHRFLKLPVWRVVLAFAARTTTPKLEWLHIRLGLASKKCGGSWSNDSKKHKGKVVCTYGPQHDGTCSSRRFHELVRDVQEDHGGQPNAVCWTNDQSRFQHLGSS